MTKDLKLWQFIRSRLKKGESVMLLVVAESSGSSPGRAGYKMAVSADGELYGSIGGGVMEVELVERAKSKSKETKSGTGIVEQVHRKNVPHSSGMICSGRQTVIVRELTGSDSETVDLIIEAIRHRSKAAFEMSNLRFQMIEGTKDGSPNFFSKKNEDEFLYQEKLGKKPQLFIVGGGHCALALSEVASKIDFRISIFDDRPELNTLAKNEFADSVTVIDSYEDIAGHIPVGDDVYVVVMTLGYRSDAVVIRRLIDHELKYFGVLGSKAKMATLMRELRDEGFDEGGLARIRTPIGIPINSHSPEEIAVSIAAELISVKNR